MRVPVVVAGVPPEVAPLVLVALGVVVALVLGWGVLDVACAVAGELAAETVLVLAPQPPSSAVDIAAPAISMQARVHVGSVMRLHGIENLLPKPQLLKSLLATAKL